MIQPPPSGGSGPGASGATPAKKPAVVGQAGRKVLAAALVDAGRTIVPERGDRHGPLPPLLLVLTAVTGIVDAVSFLRLGQVFVANMTGNTVFIGFGLAGDKSLSVPSSLVALGAFLLAALAAGRLVGRVHHRGRLLSFGVDAETLLLAAALIVDLAAGWRATTAHYVLIVLLAFAMAVQNAIARALAVPDLRTTVLTLTITGLAADLAARTPSRPGRRILTILAMFAGALGSGALALHVSVAAAIGVAVALSAGVAVVGHLLSRGSQPWTAPVDS